MHWSFASQLLVTVTNFATGVAAARLLGLEAFGQIALVLVVMAFCDLVQSTFLTLPMMTHCGRRGGERRGYFAAISRIGLVLSLASGLFAAVVIGALFGLRDGSVALSLVLAAGAATLCQNLYLTERRIAFARERGRTALAMDVGRFILLAIGIGGFVLADAEATVAVVLALIAVSMALPVLPSL
ncbi:MAG: hypothetical protein AAFX39_07395, partial [Pseudomonadota bacterium]